MRPIKVTVASQAASAVLPLDTYQGPFNVGIGCSVAAGSTLTYTVQHTFDDVFSAAFDPATATWFSNATIAAKTTSSDGNYAYPVSAVRLNVTAFTAGSVTMTVIQAGSPGS